MTQTENPNFCPFFVEISDSFKLKAPVCPNAKGCLKVREECLILSDLEADVRASNTVLTDEELEQERLIANWLKEKGINPSSLL